MPIPDAVARFNRVATNHVVRPFAARVPGMAVVHHQGRTSGRAYKTPVSVFHRQGEYVVALPYGTGRDWVKNVLAAGGCELEIRGRLVRVGGPRLVHDESRADAPPGVRQILRAIGVADFLHLTVL